MQNHHVENSKDRNRFRRLVPFLAIALLLPVGWAAAQTPDTSETDQTPSTETSPETQSVGESESGGCPGCGCAGCGRGRGQAKGQGGGRGCQGGGQGQGCKGRGQGRQGAGQGGGRGGSGRPEAQVIHFLIENHGSLKRTVEEVPGGVRTRTVSQDPEIIDAVRVHVRQMVELIHGGGRIRNWDPLFQEIFDRREATEMQVTDIEGGVEVTEISSDEQVVKLIRAHAIKVEEFVDHGLEAYREETPIPQDYSATRP